MKPSKIKLPRARALVCWTHLMGAENGLSCWNSHPELKPRKDVGQYTHLAVIPCHTAKDAKALVRVANMDRKELLRIISKELWSNPICRLEGQYTVDRVLTLAHLPTHR